MSNSRIDAQLASTRAHITLMAKANGCAFEYRGSGVIGCISPHLGTLGLANIAMCERGADLRSALPKYHELCQHNRVTVSTLWDWQGGNGAVLETMGYRLVGYYPAISIELADLPTMDLGSFRYQEIEDLSIIGRLNAEAFGVRGRGLEKALVTAQKLPYRDSLRINVASISGGQEEPDAAVLTLDQEEGGDVTGMWLARARRARGHQIGQHLYLATLYAARDRGMTTASGQAAPAAVRIYEGWGFKRVDKFMWDVYERRLPLVYAA